jgi:hypothetical protein
MASDLGGIDCQTEVENGGWVGLVGGVGENLHRVKETRTPTRDVDDITLSLLPGFSTHCLSSTRDKRLVIHLSFYILLSSIHILTAKIENHDLARCP